MHELIVYLEPNRACALRQCLDHFLLELAPRFYLSTAIKYPPHVSVTGFFKVNNQLELNSILAAYEGVLSSASDHPTASLTPLLAPTNPPPTELSSKHLLLPVTVPACLYDLLTHCAHDINKTMSVHIRPKRMDHISLAYWDEPQASPLETDAWLAWCNGPEMETMKQDLMRQLGSIDNSDTSWSIVIYERIHQGAAVGEKHQFQELSRWLIS